LVEVLLGPSTFQQKEGRRTMATRRLYFDPTEIKDPRLREMLIESLADPSRSFSITGVLVQRDLVDVHRRSGLLFVEIEQHKKKPDWLQNVHLYPRDSS
jgi:hypothetical protein